MRRATLRSGTGIVPVPGAPCDAVVVLGAEVFGPGRASAAVARRIAHGVGVWREHGSGVLVVSGGIGKAAVSEAAVMAGLAVTMGVPPGAIVLEESSHNTLEQAAAVARIARDRGWETLVVVSDRFHVPRARFLFHRMGLEVAGAPVAGPGEGSRLKWLLGWVREGAAWIKVLGQWAGGSLRRTAAGVVAPPD